MTTIRFRRGTASQWAAARTVLASGEPGYETDTGLFKVGDGVTAWNALGYVNKAVLDRNYVPVQTIAAVATS